MLKKHLVTDYTLKELQKLDYFFTSDVVFNEVIIVPTGDVHDSGYRCMKYVLAHRQKIVAVIGGGSDVLHLNGIGGYGLDWKEALETQKVPVIDWSIDCLDKSGCVRLFSYHILKIDDLYGSDVSVYSTGDMT